MDIGSVQVDPQPFPFYWAILLALSGELRQRRYWAIASLHGHENLGLEDPLVSAIRFRSILAMVNGL
jgi:hypothetical protein